MRKLLLAWATFAQLFAQTIDINALRMNASKFPTTGVNQPVIKRETQSEMDLKLDRPVEKDKYKVGPGDRFEINIISSDDVFTYSLVVSPTGEILIPSIGIVQVHGKSLSKTIQTLKQLIRNWNQSAKSHITLASIREFNVKIIGHLKNPGLYQATPVSRISDIYQMIIEDSHFDENNNPIEKDLEYPELSKRNIQIFRSKDTIEVDLVKFGATGLDKYNPFIEQGDIILVPLKQHIYSIFGGIKIPGQYEYVEGETLLDLIHLAGGLRPDADPEKIEITRFKDISEKFSFETNYKDSESIIIEQEDHIMVRYEQDYKRQDVVYVTGEVRYPGVYAIDKSSTIKQILEKAGGFTRKANPSKLTITNPFISSIPDREAERILLIPEENRGLSERAYIKARALTKKGTIESNSLLQTDLLMDFNLVNNDNVHVPENYYYVEVLGGVLKPGRYPYDKNKPIEGYIKLAGGMSQTSTKNIYIIKAGTGQRLPAKKNVIIENGDIIFIADKMEYNGWTVARDILTALGQVAALIVVIQNATGG